MAQAADTLTPRHQVAHRPAAPGWRSVYGHSACLVWITAAAAWIGLGDIHRDHTSDSILPALQSLYRWQPYYWEQNRYGMPVALLAAPVRNPLHNLLFQNALTIWLGLAAFPLAVRYFRGATCRPGSPEVARSFRDGLFAAAAFALFAPLHFQFVYLTTDNVFGTSLALGLAALILLEKPGRARLAAALLLMILATWCNTAIGALLLFLVVGLTPLQNLFGRVPTSADPTSADHTSANHTSATHTVDDRRRLRRCVLLQIALSVAAVAVGLEVLGRIPPPEYRNTSLILPELDRWPALVAKQFRDLRAANDPLGYWAALVAACAIVVAVAARRRVPGAARAAAMLSLTALAMGAFAVAMGILVEGRWRYGIPAMVLLHAAAVAAATFPLPAAPLLRASPPQAAWSSRATWPPCAAAVLLLILLAFLPWQHGLPSYARVRSDLFARFDVGRRDVVDARCTHVAGDYWRVWPAVFAANCRLYEEGADRTVWGLAHRSMPTESSWRSIPAAEIRAATFIGDPEAERYLQLLAPNWSEAERRDPLAIHVVGEHVR